METNYINKKTPKKCGFNCDFCGFITHNKKDYSRHLSTSKHINKSTKCTNTNKNGVMANEKPHFTHNKQYKCGCGKMYLHMSSLCKHKKKCGENTVDTTNQNEHGELNDADVENTGAIIDAKPKELDMQTTIVELLKQNHEFQKQIIELMKDNIGNTNNVTNNNITNNSTTNNKFNLNVFLNEKCKDALNLTDFISNLNVGFADFENFGKIGYSNSISHIFIRGLKELDIYKRPIHCSDLKREVIHIKDDNTWKKDDEKEQMIKAIKMIEHKNIKQIPDWIKAHPAHADIRSKKFDEYSKMLDQSMGEYEDEDNQKNYQKIIRNVAKEILVDKDK